MTRMPEGRDAVSKIHNLLYVASLDGLARSAGRSSVDLTQTQAETWAAHNAVVAAHNREITRQLQECFAPSRDLPRGVRVLVQRRPSMESAIEQLNAWYREKHGLSAYDINRGSCEEYAHFIEQIVPGSEAWWGDELCDEDDDAEVYAYHCIVEYRGKFYDSEHPYGVADFRDISAFHNNPTTFS